MSRAANRFDVNGLRELGESLRELEQDVTKRIIFSASLKGAQVIKKRASELAPVASAPHRVGRGGPVVPPGNLSRGVATKRLRQLAAGKVAYEVRWKAKKKGDPFYGLFFEFGTSKMAARPFMRPAFEQTKYEALAAVTQTLRVRIERAAERAKKRV